MINVTGTGFAEFTSGLLGGVLDAIVGAQLDQVRKLAELQRAVAMDDAAFAAAYIGDAQVQAALAAQAAPPLANPSATPPTDIPADTRALRLALAREQRGLLQAVLARGLPRVVVDHGRVSARLMFSMDEGRTTTPEGGRALPGLGPVPRLRATPVHARHPEFLRLQTQVTSEVEITFKTVSD
jgi:hypothetical protein